MSAIEAARHLREIDLLVREAETQCRPEVDRAALMIGGCLSGLTPAEVLVLLMAVQRSLEANHQDGYVLGLRRLTNAAAVQFKLFKARSERRTPFGEPGFPLSPAEAQRMENEA